MKISPAVRRATLMVATGVLLCSAVMQLIYLIVVLVSSLTWHYSFVLGNLLMGAASILNFFLMSYNMQRIIESGDAQGARRRIQFNHMLRSLMMLGVLVIAFLFRRHFNIVATIVTVAFPQVAVLFSRLILRKKEPDEDAPIEGTFNEEEPETALPLASGGEEDNEQS